MSTEQKPVNCRCGRKAWMKSMYCEGEFYSCVKCSRDTHVFFGCWTGPYRKTPAAAVKAWDKVMEKAKKKVE